MKHLASVLATLCLLVAAQAFAVTASFTLPSAATTSAGVYDSNGVLVRTLWSNVSYNAGTYTANWNGIDDMGVLRPNGSYELRVLSNNVQYTWEGVVGNTSDNSSGLTIHHGLDPYVGLAISGTSMYFAGSYQERLASATKASTTNPQQRTKNILGILTTFYGVVTDGTYVYWAVRDAQAAGPNSFVLVTKTSDDTEASLSDATQLTMAVGGSHYTSVLDYVSGTGTTITGLAVQKTGTYLFVARRDLNRLDVLNKTTGSLVQTLTFTAPGALTVDANDNLWIVTNATLVTKYSVAANGTLSSLGGITSGLLQPLALAVSPDGASILIADGGASQQVKGYSTSTFASVGALGQAGGYSNGPAVTDDKFFFRDTFRNNGDSAYLAFQPDGKLWVGDVGNSRALRFDTTGAVDARIQYVPAFYYAKVDQNDSTRVFANFLEFSVDYSKPLAANNGSWTLVRNWSWSVVGPYYRGGLRSITTLPTYGRTFALITDSVLNKSELVELPAIGNLRFTGKYAPDNWWALGKDGAFRWQSKNCSNLLDAEGTQITWKMQPFTGLDMANNPSWGSTTTVATSPVLSSREICANVTFNEKASPWEITSGGVLLAYQDDYSAAPDWHLQGLDTARGQWKFRAAPTTNQGYKGPYPPDGAFDIGNGTGYAGGSHHASGRHVFWQYHGEFWRGGQTNKWMHLYEDGLVVGQFGVVSGSPGVRLGDAAAQMAGNAYTSAVVTAADGSLYIYHCDESWHGGVHRWHVTNLSSIHEDSIPITLGNSFQSGLQGTYYDDMSLSNLKPVTARIDSTVDFNWGTSAPAGTALSHANNYSVRWQGFVKPRYSETYTFYTSSDDGVRLWVDNVLVIDKWQLQAATEWNGTVRLEADKLYQVKVEYFQQGGAASAQLSWSSTSQAKEIVPSSRLFFTDVAPTFNGLNIHEGLWYNVDEVSDGLYGWHRDPAQNVTANVATNWWTVDTSRYVYRKDLPVDIHVSHNRDGDASVWRDLRPAGAAAVSSWTLSGNIAYGSNWNRDEYNPSGIDNIGQYLEVLDDAGKIIARMYPRNTPTSLAAIYANNTSTAVKTTALWGATIVQTAVPFSIHAANGKLDFTFDDGSAQQVNLLDPGSNWQKPATLRLFFFHARPNWGYGVESSLSGVTFVTTP